MMMGMDSGKGKVNVLAMPVQRLGLYEFFVSLLEMLSCHGLGGIDR